MLEIVIPGEITEFSDTARVFVLLENTRTGCGDILHDHAKGGVVSPKVDGFAKGAH